MTGRGRKPTAEKQYEYYTRLTFIKNEIERNQSVTYEQLGIMCGISRERIRQILKKAGIKKPHARKIPYSYCSKGHQLPEIQLKLRKETPLGRSNQPRCIVCKPLKPYQWIDQDTGRIRSKKNILEITCYGCGKTKTFEDEKAVQRKRYDAYRKHPDMQFCSKECMGSFAGKKWGWGKDRKGQPPKKNPEAKSETIHGPCDECGKLTVQARVKKQYMEDPSVGKSYRNKRMYCSRSCMATFRIKQTTKELENYIETNTTPTIKRIPNGSWKGSLRMRSIPNNQKDKSGGRSIIFIHKTRIVVQKKLMAAIRKELRYRTTECKVISTKEEEDKKIHEQNPDWVNSGYIEPNSPGALSTLYGYISKQLSIRRR